MSAINPDQPDPAAAASSKSRPSILLRYGLHLIALGLIALVLIPLMKIEGLNPLVKTLEDFTFSDIYFSRLRKSTPDDTASSSIYIMDIGTKDKAATRKELAEILEVLKQERYRPKVIGIDILFEEVTDTLTDNALSKALATDNIVLPCELITLAPSVKIISKPEFLFRHEHPIGYAHQWVASQPGTERHFVPEMQIGDTSKPIIQFAVAIAKMFDPNKYQVFRDRYDQGKKVMINYRGRYTSNTVLASDTAGLAKLKDKILLLGLYSFRKEETKKGSQEIPVYTDDLHWTPRNLQYLGKANPDMYGVEIQAHIIASIIKNDNIWHKAWLNQLMQALFSLLLYFLLFYNYRRNKIVFKGLQIVSQLLLVAVFLLLSIFQIHWFNIYLDYTFVGIFAFFSPELIELIEEGLEKLLPRIRKWPIIKKLPL